MKRNTPLKITYLGFIFVALLLPCTSWAGLLIDNVTLEGQNMENKLLVRSSAQQGNYSISWQLTKPGRVTAFISDMKGNIVTTFMTKEEKEPGIHTVHWDGMDGTGIPCPAGLYFPIIRLNQKPGEQRHTIPQRFPGAKRLMQQIYTTMMTARPSVIRPVDGHYADYGLGKKMVAPCIKPLLTGNCECQAAMKNPGTAWITAAL